MTVQECKSQFEKDFPDLELRSMTELDNSYMIGARPKNIPKDKEYISGPIAYMYDKKTGKAFKSNYLIELSKSKMHINVY